MKKLIALLMLLCMLPVCAWAETVTVTYIANNGRGQVATVQAETDVYFNTLGADYFDAPAGQQFYCWLCQMEGKIEQFEPNSPMKTGKTEITFTADWVDVNAQMLDITLDLNGGTLVKPAPQPSPKGKDALLPPCDIVEAPAGMQFYAWEVDGKVYPGGGIYKNLQKPLTIKALWIAEDAPIALINIHANGGTGSMNELGIELGQTIALPECEYTAPEGMRFKAWNIQDTEYAPGAPFTVNDGFTMMAVWEALPQYAVTFDGNGATAGEMASATVQEGGEYTLPWCDFTREGHNFEGWLINGEGELRQPYETITVTADTKLVASWDPYSYVIHFSAGIGEDGNNSAGASLDKDHGVGFNLPEPGELGFTCAHHEFVGWKDETNGPNENGKIYAAGEEFVPTGFIILVAQWKPLEYKVTFLPGESGTGTMEDGTATYGYPYNLPECTFKPLEGYEFKAWLMNGYETPVGTSLLAEADTTVTALWQIKTYTVTYQTGDGMGSVRPVEDVPHGQTVRLAEPPEVDEKWDFVAWVIDGRNYRPGQEITVTGDVTAVAQWKVRDVRISYENDEGETLFVDDTLTYGKSHRVLTLEELNAKLEDGKKLTAPQGYVFKGWQVLNTAGGVIDAANPGDMLPVYSIWKLRANWVPEEPVLCTVSYNANGAAGSIAPVQVEAGTVYTIAEPNALDAGEGLQFDCWMIGDQEYRPGEKISVTGDIEIVAQWKIRTVSLTYQDADGNNLKDPIMMNYGAEHTVLTPEALQLQVPQGSKFSGWAVYNNRGGKLDDVQAVSGQAMTVYSDWLIRPVWAEDDTPRMCTISFECSMGTGSMEPVQVAAGSEYILPEPDFTPNAGYEFRCWSVGEKTFAPGDAITVTDDITVWTYMHAKVYKLTLDPGEGEGRVLSEMRYYGDELALGMPEAYGYTYAGHKGTDWHDGTNYYSDFDDYILTKDVVFIAQWEKLEYEVTFAAGEGSGEMTSATVKYDDEYTLPECTLEAPTDKCFKAWSVDGVEYAAGQSITVKADTTVTAVWTWITYEVSFDAQGGTGTMAAIPAQVGTQITVPACTFTAPQGMMFDGWYLDNVRYETGDALTVNGNMTLKAGWTKSERVITYKSSAADDAEVFEDPIKAGTAYKLKDNMFTPPEGKLFRCWLFPVPPQYTEHEELDPGAEFSSVKADLVFIADWETMKHAVSFDGSQGGGSMDTVVLDYGSEFAIPQCEFTAPAGMVFAGWDITGDYEMKDGSLIIKGAVTLKAKWEPMDLSVNFEGGECGSGTMTTETAKYGMDYTLPACGFSYASDDYIFLGWNLDGTYYAPGEAVKLYSDTTFTAMWAQRWYTITIKDSNESADAHRVTVEYNKSYTLGDAGSYGFAPKDERIHVFDCWMRTSDQKTYSAGDTISGIKRNMTIEAKWTFGTIVEKKDEVTGEIVESVAKIEVTTQPEEIDPDDADVMNTSDPSELPPQLGDMLATLQRNTANADEAQGGVVIETMQDVVDELHDSINDSSAAPDEEPEYPVENIVVTDIIPVLEVEIDGKVEIIKVTDKDMLPDDRGIEVGIEIPAGTDPATHHYKIAHMLTQDAWDGSGMKAGDVETLTVHRYDEKYLYVWMKNFSPVAVAWKELPAEETVPGGALESLPKTGDASCLMGWIALLGASGAAFAGVKRRKK